ncbi:MAG: hypothetical protein JWR15_2228 [Prosthecobacter sp.]|nr:hypothetical protein [Prosthecobacter sp.]
MQVSWIDPDRIKALVAQITPEDISVGKAPTMVEIDTTPAPLPETMAESWGFAMDWTEPALNSSPAAAEIADALSAEPTSPEPQAEMEEEEEMDEPAASLPNPAAALPLNRIRDKLRAIRQRATEAGILTRTTEVVSAPVSEEAATPPPPADERDGDRVEAGACTDEAAAKMEPQAPAFEVPHGSRDVRLSAFAAWARKVLHEDGGHVLVMSDDGEVLWGGEAKAGLVLSTMMAWGAAIRASAMSACETPPVIHQPLASGNVLTVIPCETAVGMVHAAVAAPSGLTLEQAQLLRGALCAAMS